MTGKERSAGDYERCPFAEYTTNPIGQERIYCRCPGSAPTATATADFCAVGLLPCSRYDEYMTKQKETT